MLNLKPTDHDTRMSAEKQDLMPIRFLGLSMVVAAARQAIPQIT
jgi:hypothetical protein